MPLFGFNKIPHYDSQQFSLLKHIHYFIKKSALFVRLDSNYYFATVILNRSYYILLSRQLRNSFKKPVEFLGDLPGLFLLGHVTALRNDNEG